MMHGIEYPVEEALGVRESERMLMGRVCECVYRYRELSAQGEHQVFELRESRIARRPLRDSIQWNRWCFHEH